MGKPGIKCTRNVIKQQAKCCVWLGQGSTNAKNYKNKKEKRQKKHKYPQPFN